MTVTPTSDLANASTTSASSRSVLAAWVLFGVVAIGISGNAFSKPMTRIPLGTESSATVPLFNVWTVWWNADRLAYGLKNYGQAPIFFPATDSFFGSECQPTTCAVAPVIWITGSPILAYNIYLWASFTLNGGLAFHLLKRMHLRDLTAILGGLLVERLPFVMWQSGVLQLTVLAGILATILSLWNWLESPTVFRGCQVGIAFGLTFWSCNYYALFLSVLLTITLPVFWKTVLNRWREAETRGERIRLFGSATLGITIAASMILPIALHQRQIAQREHWTWSAERVASLSADPLDYLSSPFPGWEPFTKSERQQQWPLGCGVLVMLAGMVGGISLIRSPQLWERELGWFWAVFGLAAFLFSLGLRGPISIDPANGESPAFGMPYQALRVLWPGFQQLRSPFRFAVCVQIAITVLAAVGWEKMCQRLGTHSMRNGNLPEWLSRWQYLVPVGLGLLMLAESWPTGLRTFSTDDTLKAYWGAPGKNLAWVNWMREKTAANDPILGWPITTGQGVTAADYEIATFWMLAGTQHRRPLVNGYSGYFPLRSTTLFRRLKTFPDADSLAALGEIGCEYVVVKQGFSLREHPRLDVVFRDREAGISIIRIRAQSSDTGP